MEGVGWLYWGLLGLWLRGASLGHAEDLHAARGACLLSLEPGAQARRVEDVVTRQLLAGRRHVLPTDDAHVVSRRQLLLRHIWVPT